MGQIVPILADGTPAPPNLFKRVVNAVGGCVGWYGIGEAAATVIVKKLGTRVVTKFVPYIGEASCVMGAYAAW